MSVEEAEYDALETPLTGGSSSCSGINELTKMPKFQEDMKWELNLLDDMCQKGMELRMDENYDEQIWEQLDLVLVHKGEQDEMRRFREMGVYSYVDRETAYQDKDGVFVKVKWVRINKGTADNPKVRCRLVAQELGYGVKEDELFAGTPSSMAVKVVLSRMAS